MFGHFGSTNRCEADRPHVERFMPFIVPLAIGFMLGMRKSRMHHGMGARGTWENGVPPFFAELHRRAHAAADQPAVNEA